MRRAEPQRAPTRGPDDHQTVESAIASEEALALKLIWKAFPGNQSRAESMAKRLATSDNPVTRYDDGVLRRRANALTHLLGALFLFSVVQCLSTPD